MFTRTLLYCWFLCLSASFLLGQGPRLSEMAEVSLITCAPGTEVYEIYGHSAFRVRDPQLNLDKAYNYGSFEFGPGFQLRFMQGKLKYFLNSYSFQRFMAEYEYYKRSVVEQVLNLDQGQKQAIFDYLTNNEKRENRYYQYDFFYDNCATRERDVIASVLGDRLEYTPKAAGSYGSLRDLIHHYQAVTPWTSFGIDLMLGMPTDKVATLEMAMFLPDYLHDGVKSAKVQVNGEWQSLVKHEALLYRAPLASKVKVNWHFPLIFCWLLFAIGAVLTFTQFGRKRVFRLFDSFLFLSIGILGIVMLLLWFATDHKATYNNLNVLWAFPTHLIFAFLIWFRKADGLVVRYASVVGLLYLGFLVFHWFLPQAFHPGVYPLILLMLFRMILYRFRSLD
ncbi:MAG TPA: DUF4105 domain-containing protein [Bacteroidetes bacterium]|nr:DUF4105 domain-containing protein [Bacteroidota bacterium]